MLLSFSSSICLSHSFVHHREFQFFPYIFFFSVLPFLGLVFLFNSLFPFTFFLLPLSSFCLYSSSIACFFPSPLVLFQLLSLPIFLYLSLPSSSIIICLCSSYIVRFPLFYHSYSCSIPYKHPHFPLFPCLLFIHCISCLLSFVLHCIHCLSVFLLIFVISVLLVSPLKFSLSVSHSAKFISCL